MSPHRFLGEPQILAAVVPLHARLVQFLRQYLELRFPCGAPTPRRSITSIARNSTSSFSDAQPLSHNGNGIGDASTSTSRTDSGAIDNLNLSESESKSQVTHLPVLMLDFDNSTILGHPLPALASAMPEQRIRLGAMVNYSLIHDNVDVSLLASLGFTHKDWTPTPDQPDVLSGSGSHIESAAASASAERSDLQRDSMCCCNDDWRWLFAFCIAALNDIRMDEVSQQAYAIRLAMSTRFTPLVMELLSRASPDPES